MREWYFFGYFVLFVLLLFCYSHIVRLSTKKRLKKHFVFSASHYYLVVFEFTESNRGNPYRITPFRNQALKWVNSQLIF